MPRNKQDVEGTRAPNGQGAIYFANYDQQWHGRIVVGIRDDGSEDRRHRRGKTEKEVADKLKKLRDDMAKGTVRKPGHPETVEQWLMHWVEDIAAPGLKPKALAAYRTAVYQHLIPGLGKHRIHRIEPEHFEKLYKKMEEAGLKASTAHQVHRTAMRAFKIAHKRGRIVRNPVALVTPPRVEEEEIEPLTVDDARAIIEAAARRRNGLRYSLALALGIRKGEALGLKWSRLDLDKGILRTPKQLQRLPWDHGCKDPVACAAPHHKSEPCPRNCKKRHKKCPPVCPPGCVKHAAKCPERINGGLREQDVKSRAGKRGIGIPAPLVAALSAHKIEQDAERVLAAELWEEGDWVFCQPTGKPIDPRRDHDEWKSLLAEAGVRDARLHDARHTAATMLLALKVDQRTVMDIMGWSELDMLVRYQHVSEEMLADVAKRIHTLLWGATETKTETKQVADS